ncbi:achaete-scute homolog 4 [Monodelphis domestica]|uniref:Achaete-scute family bHLH transcription factor 4 n=1 Tax=Monodelphis domestica TaxID=13616 RepID=F6VDC8_MONDO|nr:achaete-scute homolog 4 [Monodelphis domestica]
MEGRKSDRSLKTIPYHLAAASTSVPGTRTRLSLGEPFRVSFHLDRTYWDQAYYRGCSGRFACFPLPGQLGVLDCAFEPAFIQKRNERERQRVRCVNEGYARLRDHLPRELVEKRLSKVETLRAAIGYIKHLQSLLDRHSLGACGKAKDGPTLSNPDPRAECNSDGESKTSSVSSPYSESEVCS